MEEKVQLKHDIKTIAKNVLLYEVIFMGIVALFLIMSAVIQNVNTLIQLPQWLLILGIELEGIGYLVAGVTAIVVYYKRQKLSFKSVITYRKRTMRIEYFLVICFLLLGTQFVFSELATVMEWLLNQMGFSMLASIQAATEIGTTSVSMMIYAGFIGPIFEEFLMRGGVAYRLQRYSSIVAILISALLFGAFHMNLIQGIFAFFAGSLFAIIALEFSWGWAVFFHIFNNYVLGDLFPNLMSTVLSDDMVNVAMEMLTMIGAVSSVIILWMYREEIRTYLHDNKTPKGMYRVIFSSIWLWIFIVLCILVGLLGISPL